MHMDDLPKYKYLLKATAVGDRELMRAEFIATEEAAMKIHRILNYGLYPPSIKVEVETKERSQ